MKAYAPRTVTAAGKARSRPLADFRDLGAFVLLGDPGAGKTAEFERETEALGDDALFYSVRDFLALAETRAEEWSGKTLFLDGLDEIRVECDPRTPLDEVRKRLDGLGRPQFRLSCRGVDWLGTDQERLKAVSPTGSVTVLRLDPLGEADIERLLEAELGVAEARLFLKSAREKGLAGWLRNPQGIEILVKAFAAGQSWPSSRREAFESACRAMAGERNREHRDAVKNRPKPDEILDAAGELSATLLLAGAAECSLDDLDDLPTDPGLARAALETRLFTETDIRRFAPHHRQIAEFLGARHLTQRVESGLPVGRVFALMMTPDGAPPTPLRGLAAWFAALCPKARPRLIERDAVGLAAYGDLHDFSPDEKKRLLNRIHAEDPKLSVGRLSEDALRPLAVPELAPTLREILERPGRADADQIVTRFVLRALALGEPMPDFADLLLEVARDETRWSVTSREALDAFFHNGGRTEDALRLLRDIRRGDVRDPDRELLGTLLSRLYPAEIAPDEIWNYLLDQPNQLLGRYSRFWDFDLFDQTPENHFPDLLETLGSRLPGLRPALHAQFFDDLPARLLVRTLEYAGDEAPVSRLHDWFRIGGGSDASEPAAAIRSFLEARPDLHKALWLEGLKRCPEAEHPNVWAYRFAGNLSGARLPGDFGRFCLDQAVELADARPRLAEWLLREAVARAAAEEIPLDELRGRVGYSGELKELLPKLLQTSLPHGYLAMKRDQREFTAERLRLETEWESRVRSEKEALQENRASPTLLHGLALGYLETRKRYFLGPGRGYWPSDPALVEAALAGLRGVPYRPDVPEAAESRSHHLSLPFLAGLELMEQEELTDEQWRTALALYYAIPTGRPLWYRELLQSRPDLVAEVFVQYQKAKIAAGSEVIEEGLRSLIHDPEHSAVAQQAVLPLLRGFPVRARGGQLRILDYLLWAALRHADQAQLRKTIAKKTGSKSVTVAQRAHWLAAGLIAAPQEHRAGFEEFTRDRDEAIREVAAFLVLNESGSFPESDTEPETLGLLIRRLGPMFGPDEEWKGGAVGLPTMAAARTRTFIEALGTQPASDAGDALDSLLDDPTLAEWRKTLELARVHQRTANRDAGYAHTSPERVAESLRGWLPANPADLLALVSAHLDDFAAELRGGDENAWRGFWNEDSYGRPQEPKPEPSCRDALLAALRNRLGGRIKVFPEAQHASNTSADLRVSCDGMALPIEIKREGHPGLWTAVSEQLIAKYTTLPAAQDHGIYLVLWFGRHRIRKSPTGHQPKNPGELKQTLEDSLPRDAGSTVKVCVLDVTRPVNSS